MAVKGSRRSQGREAYWRRMVHGQRASGLSIRQWCGQQGVTEASFYAWRRTLANRGVARSSTASERPARLFAVDVTGAAPNVGAPLQLALADVRIEIAPGFDGETLRRVLAVLREAAQC